MTLGKLRLFSRFSGTEPRSSKSFPDSLHQDATCTWSPLLSQNSLNNGPIHKASPCYSDCNVSVFMLGCNFRPSRSRSVRNSPRCSMTITKQTIFATMNVELVSNIMWVNACLYTIQRARALSSSECFLKPLKGLAFAIITLTIQMRFW